MINLSLCQNDVINDGYHLSLFPVMVIIDKNYLSRFKLIAKNTGNKILQR